jgi:very-short-patch-repair endonuclease
MSGLPMTPRRRPHKVQPDILAHARDLRRPLTPAEGLLWQKLRDRQLCGLKFRRQHPIGGYIADFCCPAQRLIIELDGDSHSDQVEYDETRTQWLISLGYTVVRFANVDIRANLDAVLQTIADICNHVDASD